MHCAMTLLDNQKLFASKFHIKFEFHCYALTLIQGMFSKTRNCMTSPQRHKRDTIQYILVYPALDYSAPRLSGRVSLLRKGEKALSNKPPSFRFSAIVLMKVKLFNNLFC